jgi:hypothetical protein
VALLGFLLLLPFFALLVWLALIARTAHSQKVLQQSGLCLAFSALTSVLAFEQASAAAYPIWPHIVAAMVAFSVFLLLGSVAFLRLPKAPAPKTPAT